MPDTITTVTNRLARLERRVSNLERAQRAPRPPWRDVPLTGSTSIPDPKRAPQVRENPWAMLEFSGRIGLPEGRAADGTVIALLPEDYWPAVPRTVPVASDARRELYLEIDTTGRVTLAVQNGGSVKASWISLDSASCRTEDEDDE
ncbi:hypothetical protein K7472_08025 [Streptomyces sp. PTM05]|uniref:Uncharacterized protein n=1 Tax=Streptantibioticus parmotrematis TaxID=2873249 RepID=A0ABS7QSJ2_9ACTN|nr:hypothetical protein [Streptantibioticus parmotrematis]MBY8884792.1 hypothetical protein [Streptantibioticus parmotrematis]